MCCSKTKQASRCWQILTLAVAIVGLVCSGCSSEDPQRQAVRGTVTLDGQPVSGVVLVFAPTGGNQIGATTEATDGEFSLHRATGPSVGKHFVTVDVIEPDLEEYEQLRRAGKRPLSSLRIPARYSKLGVLHADVQADTENVYNFNLLTR